MHKNKVLVLTPDVMMINYPPKSFMTNFLWHFIVVIFIINFSFIRLTQKIFSMLARVAHSIRKYGIFTYIFVSHGGILTGWSDTDWTLKFLQSTFMATTMCFLVAVHYENDLVRKTLFSLIKYTLITSLSMIKQLRVDNEWFPKETL